MARFGSCISRFAIISIVIFLAAIAPKAGAQDAFPLNVFKTLRSASEYAAEGDWQTARAFYRLAYDRLSDRQKASAPPGLVYNLALSNDRMGRRHLAAIAWYRTFLSMAPYSELEFKVRERILYLEDNFRDQLDRQVALTEGIFRELRKVTDVFWDITAKDPQFVVQLDTQEIEIGIGVKQTEAARVALGDVNGALSVLREFDLSNIDSEDDTLLVYLLAAVGAIEEAVRYSGANRETYDEAVDWVGGVQRASVEACADDQMWRRYASLATQMEDHYNELDPFFEDGNGVALGRAEVGHLAARKFLPLSKELLRLGMGSIVSGMHVKACETEYLPRHAEKLIMELLLTELNRRNYELLKRADDEGGNAEQRDFVQDYRTFEAFEEAHSVSSRFIAGDLLERGKGELTVGPRGLKFIFSTERGTADAALSPGHWTEDDRAAIYGPLIMRFADLLIEDRSPLNRSETNYMTGVIREFDELLGR